MADWSYVGVSQCRWPRGRTLLAIADKPRDSSTEEDIGSVVDGHHHLVEETMLMKVVIQNVER